MATEIPVLAKVRIYEKSPNDGITVELDGKELNNSLVSLSYRIEAGSMPLLTLTMVADVEIETQAITKTEKLILADSGNDGVQY
jgi:hypothetical protein